MQGKQLKFYVNSCVILWFWGESEPTFHGLYCFTLLVKFLVILLPSFYDALFWKAVFYLLSRNTKIPFDF